MLHRYFLHNQVIREASAPCLSPGQVGLLSGWGVFSTFKVAGGVPFAFERHWARIRKDATALHVSLPEDPEAVRRGLLSLIEANDAPNCTLRLAIVRNVGGLWQGPPIGRASDLIALTANSKEWGAGVRLCHTANARHAQCVFAGAKSLSWAMNLTWLEEAQAKGFDEVILLNERGEVAECTSANIFIARGNEVWTPPLDSGCLPGVTREILLEEIRVPGIVLHEGSLRLDDLFGADDVFITSTTRDLLPVMRIEDRDIRCRAEVREALRREFSRYVNRYIAEHRPAISV